MNHWYIIRTKVKKEKDVLTQLIKVPFEVFLPLMKGVSSNKPLFPSYMFIRTNFEDPRNYQMVRYTRGVNKILGNGEKPQAISDLIVETLKEKTRDGSLIEQVLLFREGKEIIVKKGILKDLKGIIEKNIPATGRVKILFKWLSSNMRATLKYTDLKNA